MRKLIGVIAVLGLGACAAKLEPQAQELGIVLGASVGCQEFKNQVWDHLYHASAKQSHLPDRAEVMASFHDNMRSYWTPANDSTFRELEKNVEVFYGLLSDDSLKIYKAQSPRDLKETLAALEYGDHSTPETALLQQRLTGQIQKINSLAKSLKMSCSSPQQTSAPTPAPALEPEVPDTNTSTTATVTTAPEAPMTSLAALARDLHPVAVGGYQVMATGYQSCEALRKPAMTAATPDVDGITVCGKNPSNGGKIRCVSDLNQLQRSHYYLHNYLVPNSACQDTTQNPLIYDYGGKPASDEGDLNLFTNGGDGAKALGIDCSGFVFSSLASMGLKIQSKVTLRPQHVEYLNAVRFRDAEKEGFDCLKPISFTKTKTLQSGDIVAINGHIVIVDRVGSDPFGVRFATSASQCNTNVITHRNFDFSILQSSPSKNGIGMNRFSAKDYLDDSPTMKENLVKYGIEACKARFTTRTLTPKLPELTVIRHTGTPACIDKAIALRNQSCIKKCNL